MNSAASEQLRTALLHLRQAHRAASILRQLTEEFTEHGGLAPETALPLLQEAVALSRAVRRTLNAFQGVCAQNELIAHLFAARRALRRIEARAKKSTGKALERQIQASYLRAHELGFRGDRGQWVRLLAAEGS